MTTTPPESPTTQGLERGQVQTFVLALDKALRAQRLYGGRSSAFVVRLLENLERELADLLARGSIHLGVCSGGFTCGDRPLFTTDVDDIQLPWAFRMFCDGIREISFEQQLRWEELLDFLDILSTNPRESEEDLVTMLWERDFDGIRYYAADTFAAGLEVDENGDLVLSSSKRLESDAGAGLDEFALTPDDLRVLTGEDHLAWLEGADAPARADGAHAWQTARLKNSLQDVADLPRFMDMALEVVTRSRWTETAGLALVTDQLSAHIARRDFDGLVAYFQALAAMAVRGGDLAHSIVTRVLEPQRRAAIVPFLAEAGHELMEVPAGLLAAGAHVEAMALLEELPSCPFQEALEDALLGVGADLTPLYAERLSSTEPALVSASIEALGRLATVDAIKALATVFSHPSTRRRLEAIQAMVGAYHPVAKSGLLRCLDDPTVSVRINALELLREAHDPGVVRALLPYMRKADFLKRDLKEAASWYRCLTSTHESSALAYLTSQLERRNLLRSNNVVAHQVLAARAMGQLGGPEELHALQRFAGASHLPKQVKMAIRTAISAAKEA